VQRGRDQRELLAMQPRLTRIQQPSHGGAIDISLPVTSGRATFRTLVLVASLNSPLAASQREVIWPLTRLRGVTLDRRSRSPWRGARAVGWSGFNLSLPRPSTMSPVVGPPTSAQVGRGYYAVRRAAAAFLNDRSAADECVLGVFRC
jgi:hypothetical protein